MTIAILKETVCIKKYKCTLNISKVSEKTLYVCKVECKGNHKWIHHSYSIYGGYAMLREKYLLDLPGKLFLVHQINEHSKGGHYEYETDLMNLQGKVLQQFTSNYNSSFLLEDKYVWFLKSGKKPFNFTSDRDLDLVKLNINTGKIKQIINLNYAELLNCSYKHIYWVKLTIKRNQGYLRIEYTDSVNDKRKKRLLLSQLP